MPSTFTPINGRASASTAAVARAGDRTPARRRQTPGPINGTERERRRSPTTPDAIRMQVQLQKLSAEMRDPAFTWPAGITSSNAVVADINNGGVPGALAHQGKNCSSDVLKFILCAAESQWRHGKTAACLGRSELAIRIILCKMRKRAIQIQRGVDRMRQMVRPQPGEPSSTSPSPGEQSDRPVPREPPTQTTFEAQAPADQLSKVRMEDVGWFRSWPDVEQGRDLSRLDALAQVATTATDDGAAAAARQAGHQSALGFTRML